MRQVREDLMPRIQKTAVKILRDQVRAEEVAEDVLMDFLFKHIDRLIEPKAMFSYVRMMTVRRCLLVKERSQRHQQLQDDHSLFSENELDQLNQIDQERFALRLTQCLQKLKPRARQIIRQRYFHELKLDEIGKEHKITKQYVNQIIAQSLFKLKRCVGIRQ